MNQPPIIISAFGTTTKAVATYSQLETSLRNRFPNREMIWAYSSKQIARKLQRQSNPASLCPEAVLRQLEERGVTHATIQSLHLFPGTEFHSLVQDARRSKIVCAIGMPLLTAPTDYQQLCEILRTVISERPQKAILVLGHGTDHPAWTAYYSLEKILRSTFGERIYVGVVEKYPDSSRLVDEIADHGYKQVCIIPFFLVAGMHYRRDIISDSPSSWLSRLQARSLEVESIDYGLGLYPGFEDIVIRHIIEAEKTAL